MDADTKIVFFIEELMRDADWLRVDPDHNTETMEWLAAALTMALHLRRFPVRPWGA